MCFTHVNKAAEMFQKQFNSMFYSYFLFDFIKSTKKANNLKKKNIAIETPISLPKLF